MPTRHDARRVQQLYDEEEQLLRKLKQYKGAGVLKPISINVNGWGAFDLDADATKTIKDFMIGQTERKIAKVQGNITAIGFEPLREVPDDE